MENSIVIQYIRLQQNSGIMTKFGVCWSDCEKIKGITMKSYSQKELESVDSVEDPITVSEVLGTRSLAG